MAGMTPEFFQRRGGLLTFKEKELYNFHQHHRTFQHQSYRQICSDPRLTDMPRNDTYCIIIDCNKIKICTDRATVDNMLPDVDNNFVWDTQIFVSIGTCCQQCGAYKPIVATSYGPHQSVGKLFGR